MQFIDLKTQYERIEQDVTARINKVLASQKYIMGPEVNELEAKLADYVGVKHALSCSSGTDALLIALMALGIKKNDAVFVPSFTFFASAESITLSGGTPVFVDSDKTSFNLDPLSLEEAIIRIIDEGKLVPKAIMPVDLFGQLADYKAISDIAKKHKLYVIEDACQGFGATRKGRKACNFGDVAATSFFPAKPLGCYGDGGAIFTNNDELAEEMRSVRVHGQGKGKYDNVRMGINGRLDTVQAAILLAKLDIFDDELERRTRISQEYSKKLQDGFVVPKLSSGDTSAWAQYTLLADDKNTRTSILEDLRKHDIPSAIYYPIPIHLSTAYKYLGHTEGSLPICEELAKRVFSIPMHPYLRDDEINRIVAVLNESK